MSPILAQANDGPPSEVLVAFVAFVCGFYLVLLIIAIFFLLTLSRALGQCRPGNRTMEPGMVWLNLIPLFFVVWMFITVTRLSESLRNEYYDRGWGRRTEDYGQGLGIATCALFLASNIPYLGCLFFIGWIVCFIIYWLKIAGYSSQLAAGGYGYGDDYDDRYDAEDDYDDRRGRDRRDRDREEDGDRDSRPWDRGGR